MREGAAEGPRSGGPRVVFPVVLSPLWGGGEGELGAHRPCGRGGGGWRGLFKYKSWGARRGDKDSEVIKNIENCERYQGYRGIFECEYWDLEGNSWISRVLQTVLFRD